MAFHVFFLLTSLHEIRLGISKAQIVGLEPICSAAFAQ